MTTRTLRRLERAAMRWWKTPESSSLSTLEHQSRWDAAVTALARACAAHAQRKGAKRKGCGHGRRE